MAQKGLIDCYAILEISPEADEAAIKRTYRQLVLKWHPDKTPDDREKAEERIRLINAAYATLSNPAKREKYDLQRSAMEGKRRGNKPSKPRASPKMLAPKEFMLQPIGHPERFVRYLSTEKRVYAHTREDVDVAFDDFFKSTKLSLWWVPEVNNMCRVRALGTRARGEKRSVAAGVAGGLNFSFRVKEGFESEVRLAAAPKGKRADNVNFIIKASPEYEGAYRFEAAAQRGYYLCFYPTCDVRIASLLDEDDGRVLDFMLTDFNASLHYKDLEEVLCLVASPNRDLWLQLEDIVAAAEVKEYFDKVLQKPVWDLEDFVAHIEGHWQDWEYNAELRKVRLRPLPERLSELLSRSRDELETAEAIRRAGEELKEITVEAAVRATLNIAQDRDFADAPTRTHAAEQHKLLRVLPEVLEIAKSKPNLLPSPALLLDASAKVPGLVGEQPMPADLEKGKAAMQLYTQLLVEKLTVFAKQDQIAQGFSADDVLRLLQQPEIAKHDVEVKEACAEVLATAEQSILLQVVRKSIHLGCFAIADAATSSALASLNHKDADEGGVLLKELAAAGAMPDRVATLLRARATFLSAEVFASAFLCLYDRNLTQDMLQSLQDCLATKAPLVGFTASTLQELALASAKHVDALKLLASLVAEAVGGGAGVWTAGDMTKLLLAMSKQGSYLPDDARQGFLAKANVVLARHLSNLGLADLVKVVLPVSAFGPSELMEAAAAEVVIRKEDFALSQLLLVTQALLRGLPPSSPSLAKIVDHWAWKLRSGQKRVNTVVCADVFTATSGQLTVSQLVKLVTGVLPVLRIGSDDTLRLRFTEAACAQLKMHAAEATSLATAEILAELRSGGVLSGCSQGEALLASLGATQGSSLNKRAASIAGMQMGKKKKRRR
mmetsp:Transcript_2988/g.6604  ORF Transcript_2988/g.6604 Transcript_2988/m.6604 type:complete len:892 (-) Transcript_2988:68-2743(-)